MSPHQLATPSDLHPHPRTASTSGLQTDVRRKQTLGSDCVQRRLVVLTDARESHGKAGMPLAQPGPRGQCPFSDVVVRKRWTVSLTRVPGLLKSTPCNARSPCLHPASPGTPQRREVGGPSDYWHFTGLQLAGESPYSETCLLGETRGTLARHSPGVSESGSPEGPRALEGLGRACKARGPVPLGLGCPRRPLPPRVLRRGHGCPRALASIPKPHS